MFKIENWKDLEDYETVKRWMTDVQSRNTSSLSTKKIYLTYLKQFCELVNKNPDELMSERKKDLKSDDKLIERRHEEQLSRFFNFMKNKNARKTAVVAFAVIQSLYKSNYMDLKIRVPKSWVTNIDKVPTLDEIKKMMDVSESALQRAVLIFSAQSGQRNGIINALRYGMVKEGLKLGNIPLCIRIPAELKNRYGQNVNKRRQTYCFFVGRETVDALNIYLDMRGELKNDDFLFVSEKKYKGKHVGLDTMAVNNLVKRAALKAGLMTLPTEKNARCAVHHHCLRKFWQTAMEQAAVAKPWYEYMMGHALNPLDRAYSNPSLEQLKDAYQRAEPYLSISLIMRDRDDIKKELFLKMWQDSAKLHGIDPLRLRIERESFLKREIYPQEEIEFLQEAIKGKISNNINHNSHMSKVILESEIETYIEDNWDIVKELSSGKIVVRKPN